MNVLDRIVELRLERGWSEYRLTQEADISQSTVSSWFTRGAQPSVDSLERICHAFGITLSQFFAVETAEEHIISVTDSQLRLLQLAALLDPLQEQTFTAFLESLKSRPV